MNELEKNSDLNLQGQEENKIDAHVVSLFEPASAITEEFRNLCVNLFSMDVQKPSRIFVVTSSTYGEGKTITICNLAVCLARELRQRILVVDCDLINPNMHEILNLDISPGILDYIRNKATLKDIVKEGPVYNMHVVTTGGIPSEPSGILTSPRMKEFIKEVKEQFDFVMFDTASILSHADAAILGPLTDGVLLVVKSEKTQKEVVNRAQIILKNAQARILGCVLIGIKYHIPKLLYRFL